MLTLLNPNQENGGQAYHMSTFSDTGSLRMTSGAIQATVPANDILVLLSLSSFEVPKSEIFTMSSCVISMLGRKYNKPSAQRRRRRICSDRALSLTLETWGLGGWFCGGVSSSCRQRCPWTSRPGGKGWSCGPLSAPRTAGPEHSTPSRCRNMEPGCTRPWEEADHSDNRAQLNTKQGCDQTNTTETIPHVSSLERDDVWVLEFPKVFDLGLLDVPDFLHGHLLSVQLAEEDGPLRPAAHPLEVRNFLKGNLPGL